AHSGVFGRDQEELITNQTAAADDGIYGSTIRLPQLLPIPEMPRDTYGMPSTVTHGPQNADVNAVNSYNGLAGQAGSLAMPSPFDASNVPTPENAQEDLPSTGLDSHGYSQQGHVASPSNVQLEAPVPPMLTGGESIIDWQAYNWNDMSAFMPAFDLANLNLPDFTYNEPEGFEGSAEIVAKQENNNTAFNRGQWEQASSF
ncbi:hypothetical protein BKA70DRAFT_1345543, partial [Coprinopsis sp. MPI-PUGE-AT-0042]